MLSPLEPESPPEIELGLTRPQTKVVLSDISSDERIEIQSLAKGANVSEITASILFRRGVKTPEQAIAFLNPTLRDHLPDPWKILNMKPAIELLLEAVEKGKRITVYCDFDVDGLSAGAQLYLYLYALGANVNYFTPNRFVEGYGVSSQAIEKLAEAGTKVLVSVDCGITSHAEFTLAKRLGMQTLIIDHHEPNGVSPADVVVDPAQEGCPFQHERLAAAGLVWMVLIALRSEAQKRTLPLREAIPDPKEFLDLACLGTVCDMVPLLSLNRLIALRGLQALERSPRIGLIALKNAAGIVENRKMNAGHLGFAMGPRINAAGRLDDATKVLELFVTTDSLKVKSVADSLSQLNDRRRRVEEGVRDACIEQLIANPKLASAPAYALFGETFHLGVIGIAAQRLVEAYHKPSTVMAPGEAVVGGEKVAVIKGSVRGIRGFHVAEVLQELAPLLIGGGGHAQAGGFTLAVDKLKAFQEAFIDQARKRLTAEDLIPCKQADAEVSFKLIDLKLVDELSKLSPFGVGNPAPLFVAKDVTITNIVSLSNGHVRLRLEQQKCSLTAVGWRFQGHSLLKNGNTVNVAFYPEINSYKGVSSVQLNLKEIWI